MLAELLGSNIRVERMTEDEANQASVAAGAPDFVATSVLETMGLAAAALEPATDVEALTSYKVHTQDAHQ